MTQTEALRVAFEALAYINQGANNQGPHTGISWRCAANKSAEALNTIKAALEANEFNPDWDTQAVLTEEIQRMAKRIEELEAKDESYALEASMFSNDRVKVDPVTGNVSIGTPQQEAKDEPVQWKMGASGIGGTGVIVQPQRTWVGLTDDEIEMIVENRRAAHWEFVRQVEAKLKENNHG
jgi:hypothetical protein